MAFLNIFQQSYRFLSGPGRDLRMARNLSLVFCGPSGAGKSTLMNRLLNEFQECFGFSVSHTTRKPRQGEVDGQHYHFVTKEDMERDIKNGKFIETAVYSGNTYGTSKKAIENVSKEERICILDIDMQGVKQVKNSDLEPYYVFIMPPSIEDLEKRLRDRGTETAESLAKRLAAAQEEMEYGKLNGNFDAIVINDDIERAYTDLRKSVLPLVDKLKREK